MGIAIWAMGGLQGEADLSVLFCGARGPGLDAQAVVDDPDSADQDGAWYGLRHGGPCADFQAPGGRPAPDAQHDPCLDASAVTMSCL